MVVDARGDKDATHLCLGVVCDVQDVMMPSVDVIIVDAIARRLPVYNTCFSGRNSSP